MFAKVVKKTLQFGDHTLCEPGCGPTPTKQCHKKTGTIKPHDKTTLHSGMFRRNAWLAIPHLKSFAAIPSVSLAQLGHAKRNVFLSHESQREIALV